MLAEKAIPVLEGRAGTPIALDGAHLAILHPGGDLVSGTGADANNNSVVVRLTMGDFSALLPGDIEAEIEQRLVQSGQWLPG